MRCHGRCGSAMLIPTRLWKFELSLSGCTFLCIRGSRAEETSVFSRYTIRGVGISGRATVPSDEGGTFTSCIDKGRGYSMVSVLARPHRTKGVALSSVDDGHIGRRGWHYHLWMTATSNEGGGTIIFG